MGGKATDGALPSPWNMDTTKAAIDEGRDWEANISTPGTAKRAGGSHELSDYGG
jgi:hypothetical protein